MTPGLVLIGKFNGIGTYENKEPNGQIRISKSFKVQVPYPNGDVLPLQIYFPRNPNYPEPKLELGAVYSFPVEVRAKKDGRGVTYSAREEIAPFAAPSKQ
jgi:hypothetical protein